MDKYYDIHHIVAFRVIDKTGLWPKFFGNWDVELQGFEVDNLDNPDFTIIMGKFQPNNQDCTILDDNYYIRENYLYCRRDAYKYAKWQLEMSGFEQGEMIVRLHANPLGKMFIPEIIINPLIWFKLSEKGCPIVHGSAVSRNGQAYIFAGWGAAGKTTVALNFLEKGTKLLSEHFVILVKDEVLSFPTPFHIMDFNLAPILRDNLSLKHKTSFLLKQLFRHATGKRIATKILPRDILPSHLLGDRAKLQAIFLLLPSEGFGATRIGKDELINQLVANQKQETIPLVKYMMEYAYLFPQSKMATYWTHYKQNLSQALDTAQAFYRVEVPMRYDDATLGRISQLVGEC